MSPLFHRGDDDNEGEVRHGHLPSLSELGPQLDEVVTSAAAPPLEQFAAQLMTRYFTPDPIVASDITAPADCGSRYGAELQSATRPRRRPVAGWPCHDPARPRGLGGRHGRTDPWSGVRAAGLIGFRSRPDVYGSDTVASISISKPGTASPVIPTIVCAGCSVEPCTSSIAAVMTSYSVGCVV